MALHGSSHRLAPTLSFSVSEYQGFLQAGKKLLYDRLMDGPDCVCWCVSMPVWNKLSVYSFSCYKRRNETKLKPFHSVEHLL